MVASEPQKGRPSAVCTVSHASHARRQEFRGAPPAGDSGLCVDHLAGAPGLYSARYSGGHGDAPDRMARGLQSRRRSQGIGGLVSKLLGIDSKMRQYEVGERFVAAIEHEAGPRALDAAWRGPESLPTIAELATPTAWLARVERNEPAPAPPGDAAGRVSSGDRRPGRRSPAA